MGTGEKVSVETLYELNPIMNNYTTSRLLNTIKMKRKYFITEFRCRSYFSETQRKIRMTGNGGNSYESHSIVKPDE